MALFKTRSGKWRYEFEVNTARYTGSGYTTKKAARAAMEQHRANVKGERSEQNNWHLLDLILEYLDANERRLAPKTWKYKRFVYKSFLSHAGDLPLDQVVPFIVETYLRTRPSNYNANFHRKDLSALFAWGQKHGMIAHNPALQVDRFPVTKAMKKIPTQEEVARIFLAAGEYLPLLKVVYYTMARRSEALAMRWEDVNFKERWVRLWTKKRRDGNLEPDTLPMNEDLYQVLWGLWKKRIQEEWVFLNPKTGTRYMTRPKIMGTICKRAGVPHYGFHALRHFAASYLLDVQKVSMKKIQHLLRHTQLRTTEVYLHQVDHGMREVVEGMPTPEKLGVGFGVGFSDKGR